MAMPSGVAGSAPPPFNAPKSDFSEPAAFLTSPGGFSERDQGSKPVTNETDHSAPRETDDPNKDKDGNPKSPTSATKAKSATCIPKAVERIKVDLPSHRINSEIQFMQDHVLIGKFLRFWPTEKALQG